jgi:hypothetical protein
MSSQLRVNELEGSGQWARGREVWIKDGYICCKLTTRTYDLLEEYENLPHLRFIESETKENLVSFVRRWGPLDIRSSEISSGTLRMPIERYRILQRWLKAVVRLMDAYRNSDDDNGGECRHWLPKFWLAEPALRRQLNLVQISTLTPMEPVMRAICGVPKGEDTASWIRSADLEMIRLAVEYVLRNTPLVMGGYLECDWRDRKPEVQARWTVPTLEYALLWMVWCDVMNQHTLTFCRECGKPFRPQSARRRKYCNEVCAHRVAAREWRRKDLRKKKEQRERKTE